MARVKAFGICLYIVKNDSCKILLCKAREGNKWGFLKGCQIGNETSKGTAQREFYEECGIFVQTKFFEKYYEQENKVKDIGIYLANGKNIFNLEQYFENDRLKQKYHTFENEDVKFFDIKDLPKIKSKQKKIIKKVVENLGHF